VLVWSEAWKAKGEKGDFCNFLKQTRAIAGAPEYFMSICGSNPAEKQKSESHRSNCPNHV
jgi:hypothetical protein